MNYDVVVVGAGFAGSTIAERFSNAGKQVLVVEKRNHIAGNMYDYIDKNNVDYHVYGPHIFHTNSKKVVDYLTNFTSWYPYEHRVLGMIQGKEVPIPFNLKSIEETFDKDKAQRLKQLLIDEYGLETKVPILKLRESKNDEIKELAEFIYENVFKYYTMKQWGLSPEEIDPAVTGRVPVLISYDDRYFQDTYQQMPLNGYTPIFENMLNNPRIEVRLTTSSKDVITIDLNNKKTFVDGEEFTGPIVYTGAVDYLLDYQLGDLPYRSLNFEVQSLEGTYQDAATVNYPTPESVNAFTRITEYKLLQKEYRPDKTTIAIEYPMPYDRNASLGNIPYYPIFTEANQKKYNQYCELIKPISNLHLLGRLAEYKYYNMDAIIEKALELYEKIK